MTTHNEITPARYSNENAITYLNGEFHSNGNLKCFGNEWLQKKVTLSGFDASDMGENIRISPFTTDRTAIETIHFSNR